MLSFPVEWAAESFRATYITRPELHGCSMKSKVISLCEHQLSAAAHAAVLFICGVTPPSQPLMCSHVICMQTLVITGAAEQTGHSKKIGSAMRMDTR
jgi:hypothetical protein